MISELDKIKKLLWEEWDPIGVNGFGPADEYDDYAFRIFVMLNEGKGELEISEYLRGVAIESMGLNDAGDCALVARNALKIHRDAV